MGRDLFIVVCVCLGLSACVSGDGTLEQIDPEAAPTVPTYTGHVGPIMDRYCTACHAEDAQPGKVDGYGYGTCLEVKENWGSIVWTVYETKTMPPGGAQRMTSADKLTLQRWYRQGAQCD